MNGTRDQEISRSLFRESNDALFLFDPVDHRLVDANPAAQRMTGFDRRSMLGRRVWDLISGEVAGAVEAVVSAYNTTGFFHSREDYLLQARQRDPIPVNLSVARIHTRPEPLGLVVARDISDRRQAAEELRASEERYRTLVDSAGVIIWTLSNDGMIASLNPAFEVATGRAVADWIGRPFEDLVHPDDVPTARLAFEAALRGEEPRPGVLRLIAEDGSVRHVEPLSIRLAVGDGASHVAGISRDVTEQKRAEDAARLASELREAKEAAEAASRSKSLFLAHLSHEVRTPMTTILGLTELLLEDEAVAALPEDRREQLRSVRLSGRYLLELIDDLLDLSKVEMGRLRIRREPGSPSRIASEVVGALRARIEGSGVPVVVEHASPVPEAVLTDPVRLRQILINLLSNAIRHTDRGEVRLRLSADRDGPDPMLCFEVIDTGVGMTRDQLDHLFDPFARPDREPSGNRAGSGLGLGITRRLLEALGGRLFASSSPGVGSTFRVELPIVEAPPGSIGPPPDDTEAPPTPTPAAGTSAHQGPTLDARILLAEDNAPNRRMLALQLQRSGADVVAVADGQEAIDQALSSRQSGLPFHLILMDMQMPVVDGYEATRRLRSLGFRIPIIALTAYAMAEERDACLVVGCDDHAAKPVEWPRLRRLISGHLARS